MSGKSLVGLRIIERVIAAEATIQVLDRDYINLATPMGRGFMAMFSAMTEDERIRIHKRTSKGRREAIKRGVKMGRRPKLNAKQLAEIRQRLAEGESQVDLAETFAVHRTTIAGTRQ
ncbi:recombinase family protein [Bradyrhizobium elkanii]|uniref:recombinase family protein n=1 Tax=Bradyrhizobium elkanii TaxID=29448 RepID=UPI0014851187|nr:recombinase family protein [Bradyrhizobium elkanii]